MSTNKQEASTETGPGDRSAVFGAKAPVTHIALCSNGNITAAEIIAFLPNWIRNTDVCDRLNFNGWVAEGIANVANEHLDLPRGPMNANSALKVLQAGKRYTADHSPKTGLYWTPKKAYNTLRPATWDSNDLSLADRRLNIEYKPDGYARVDSIPFEDLARHVVNMPTGYDALDLTRCVEHAQAHVGEYKFPQDFQSLTLKLGGPAPVKYGHLDYTAAARYAGKSSIFRGRLSRNSIAQSDDTLVTQTMASSGMRPTNQYSSSEATARSDACDPGFTEESAIEADQSPSHALDSPPNGNLNYPAAAFQQNRGDPSILRNGPDLDHPSLDYIRQSFSDEWLGVYGGDHELYGTQRRVTSVRASRLRGLIPRRPSLPYGGSAARHTCSGANTSLSTSTPIIPGLTFSMADAWATTSRYKPFGEEGLSEISQIASLTVSKRKHQNEADVEDYEFVKRVRSNKRFTINGDNDENDYLEEEAAPVGSNNDKPANLQTITQIDTDIDAMSAPALQPQSTLQAPVPPLLVTQTVPADDEAFLKSINTAWD